jgi:hypothetical protein
MTQAKYMALADVQEIWTEKQKPFINQTFATKQELSQLKGPVYDDTSRSVVFPTTSAITYDSQSRSVVIPAVSV